jgi:copper chaperone
MQTIRLNIEGMHCGACVRRVKAALAAVPGATVLAVEIGHAEVGVEETAAADTRQALEASVRAAGFAPAPG